MEPQLENFTEPQIPKINPWIRFLGVPLGIVILLFSRYLFSVPEEGNGWVHVVRIPMLLLGLQLVTHPFRKFLKKYFVTRMFYWALQIVSVIGFFLIYAFSLIGRVMIAIMLFFALSSILISKTLEYFSVQNPLLIGLFLSFTISVIVFSYKGNSIVNRFAVFLEGGDKKNVESDLTIVNKFLGPSQIKYMIYCTYFLLIVILTTMHLAGQLPTDNDQNYMFLTLQSFAAFVAFETIVEKRDLMKPWFEALKKFRDLFEEIKKTPSQEIFKDKDDK